jgi:hypothetical protein
MTDIEPSYITSRIEPSDVKVGFRSGSRPLDDSCRCLAYVDLGTELCVSRDHGAGRDVFVSLECNCAWEVEHGLQLVFRNGREISNVGPFDGHVSNESAYANERLKGVVYKRLGELYFRHLARHPVTRAPCLAYDAAHHILYSSNMDGGLWRRVTN